MFWFKCQVSLCGQKCAVQTLYYTGNTAELFKVDSEYLFKTIFLNLQFLSELHSLAI